MPNRLKMLAAFAACALMGTAPAWAEAAKPEKPEAPDASNSSDSSDSSDEMMHPGAMGHPDMMGGEGHRAWSGPGMGACAGVGGHEEGRLAYARAELHITAAQESLWQAYATAVREAARGMATMCKDRPEANSSLPDRLDRHVEAMAARLEAMRATNRALRPLYGALDASQKKAAEEVLGMGMMRPGRWQ